MPMTRNQQKCSVQSRFYKKVLSNTVKTEAVCDNSLRHQCEDTNHPEREGGDVRYACIAKDESWGQAASFQSRDTISIRISYAIDQKFYKNSTDCKRHK